MSSALALPLGWSSENELLDMTFTENVDVEEVMSLLHAEMPDGMPVLKVGLGFRV